MNSDTIKRKVNELKNVLSSCIYPKGFCCEICENESDNIRDGICDECKDKLVPFIGNFTIQYIDEVYSMFVYNDASRGLILKFKSGNRTYLAEFFVNFMVVPKSWDYDVIVPVPSKESSRLKRGFSQCDLLAEELSKKTNKPCDLKCLKFIKETEDQKTLTRKEREKNLKNAIVSVKSVEGKNILLVDDIRTTGNTLKECARALKKQGANKIYAVTCCADVI